METTFKDDIKEARSKLTKVRNGFSDLYGDSTISSNYENSSAYTLIGNALKSMTKAQGVNVSTRKRKSNMHNVLETLGAVHKILVNNGHTTAADVVAESMVIIIEASEKHISTFSLKFNIKNLPEQYRERVNV